MEVDLASTRLKQFVTDSNEALEFRLIRDVEDLESKDAEFHPEMSHQVFGARFVIHNLLATIISD